MIVETHTLPGGTPGLQPALTVLRFGRAGARPKVTIQAALHADETPALLVAQALRAQLSELEAAGQLLGEVLLVPMANPIGLGQCLLGRLEGRFDLRDGSNFNRGHASLADAAAQRLEGQLGADSALNQQRVRQALKEAAAALPAQNTTEHLKRRLLLNAVDSDMVFDLHCDAQAVVHLYALTTHEALARELGAWVGAQAVLLASDSGGSPFDEACSRPWLQLQERFPGHPIPAACFACTLEWRGESDTSLEQAQADAAALIQFLRRHGVATPDDKPAPEALCQPTPLAASEPITAPHAGVLVFHAEPGQRLQAGDTVATLVELEHGTHTPLRCESSGVLYARIAGRWAGAGQRVAKVAGWTLSRRGELLSA
ncbi:MAG: succinylglutamate desuccinylase/aspartoacylase family protein [Rubrivivax sp.]|jgi:hypothetical protein|nr:succinylglutamate desuccinylase/aspartoacylase family protein [Rubrivivax sp.]